MESCLLNYYILDAELKNACDFNPNVLESGPGIYEVFRVINGIPLFLEEHIDRFRQSALIEQYSLNFSEKELRLRLKKLIEINILSYGNIRFQYLKHPIQGYVFLAWITPTIYPSKDDFRKGVEIVTLSATRKKPHSKRTNLPVRSMAEDIIEEEKVTEVLLLNEDGTVTEGHRSNIFFVCGEKLYTPSESLVLKGVTRDKIIQLAKDANIEVVEEDIKVDGLKIFDAGFLSSTSKNILPVNRIDDIQLSAENDLTAKLALLFDDLVAKHLKNFRWELAQ